jgi:chromate transport protein ChrA
MLTTLDDSLLHSRLPRSPWVLRFANQLFAWLERIARRKMAMCFLVAITTTALRLALLQSRPIPQPFVADEFSYLLGAETFVSGRVTNPMHPMWEHFETLHEIVRPSYMTMYPPGQSLFLALGWKLFGHPWFGVPISFGLFAGCLCWMLQNWLPPIYALFGTAIMLARISILGYWMNSYWGGALAAAGGCLVLGALPRLARTVKAKDVAVASVGLVMLANTRPFEGLVIAIAGFAALLWWRRRLHRPFRELLTLRCLLPLLLICGAVGTLDAYFNYRVTGDAFVMPYAVYFRDYRIAPPWLLLSERPTPVYRHADLENSWKDDLEKFRRIKSHPAQNLADLRVTASFYVSALCLFPLLLGWLLSRSYRLWTAAFICACLCGTLLIEMSKTPHYVAGGVGALGVMVAYGLRWLRLVAGNYGPLLVLMLVPLLCLEGRAPDKGQTWEVRSRDAISPRMMAEKAAMARGGKHLILVRYDPDHIDKSDECVYNSANIDASQTVWAHDMGEAKNQELIDYYRGSRKIWLYRPDTDPNSLIPYGSTQP